MLVRLTDRILINPNHILTVIAHEEEKEDDNDKGPPLYCVVVHSVGGAATVIKVGVGYDAAQEALQEIDDALKLGIGRWE